MPKSLNKDMSEAEVDALFNRLGVLDIPITAMPIEPYLNKNGHTLLHADSSHLVRKAIHWLLLAVYRTHGPDSGILPVGQTLGIELTSASTIEESFRGTSTIPLDIAPRFLTLETLFYFRSIVDVWVDEVELPDALDEAYRTALNGAIVVLHDLWWPAEKEILSQ